MIEKHPPRRRRRSAEVRKSHNVVPKCLAGASSSPKRPIFLVENGQAQLMTQLIALRAIDRDHQNVLFPSRELLPEPGDPLRP